MEGNCGRTANVEEDSRHSEGHMEVHGCTSRRLDPGLARESDGFPGSEIFSAYMIVRSLRRLVHVPGEYCRGSVVVNGCRLESGTLFGGGPTEVRDVSEGLESVVTNGDGPCCRSRLTDDRSRSRDSGSLPPVAETASICIVAHAATSDGGYNSRRRTLLVSGDGSAMPVCLCVLRRGRGETRGIGSDVVGCGALKARVCYLWQPRCRLEAPFAATSQLRLLFVRRLGGGHKRFRPMDARRCQS